MTDGATMPPLASPPTVPAEADESPDQERRRRRRKLLLLLVLGALLAGLSLLAIWYLIFRQPINPLPPIQSAAVMPSYTTSIYGIKRPTGVAVNRSGDRIYVTETGGAHLARVFDAAGNELARLEPPASTGTDHVPVYLAIDPLTGDVYVTDRPTGSIYIYDADGRFLRAYRPAASLDGWQPLGITFDPAGNLYVTDLAGPTARVVVLDRGGKVVRTIGVGDKLSFPNGVAIDPPGNVYVTDSNNGRLLVFGPTGDVAATVGRGVGEGNLGLPRGAVIDGQGRLYVVDTSGQAVFVYGLLDPKVERLAYLGFFGGEGVSDGLFEYPNGIAADGRGRLYVTDSVNDRVQVWSY
jgi:DNA-binding beta-propeller fold protein YncE